MSRDHRTCVGVYFFCCLVRVWWVTRKWTCFRQSRARTGGCGASSELHFHLTIGKRWMYFFVTKGTSNEISTRSIRAICHYACRHNFYAWVLAFPLGWLLTWRSYIFFSSWGSRSSDKQVITTSYMTHQTLCTHLTNHPEATSTHDQHLSSCITLCVGNSAWFTNLVVYCWFLAEGIRTIRCATFSWLVV